jgi:hypothetical protein
LRFRSSISPFELCNCSSYPAAIRANLFHYHSLGRTENLSTHACSTRRFHPLSFVTAVRIPPPFAEFPFVITPLAWTENLATHACPTRQFIPLGSSTAVLIPPPFAEIHFIITPSAWTENLSTHACSTRQFVPLSFSTAIRIPPPFAHGYPCGYIRRTQLHFHSISPLVSHRLGLDISRCPIDTDVPALLTSLPPFLPALSTSCFSPPFTLPRPFDPQSEHSTHTKHSILHLVTQLRQATPSPSHRQPNNSSSITITGLYKTGQWLT